MIEISSEFTKFPKPTSSILMLKNLPTYARMFWPPNTASKFVRFLLSHRICGNFVSKRYKWKIVVPKYKLIVDLCACVSKASQHKRQQRSAAACKLHMNLKDLLLWLTTSTTRHEFLEPFSLSGVENSASHLQWQVCSSCNCNGHFPYKITRRPPRYAPGYFPPLIG